MRQFTGLQIVLFIVIATAVVLVFQSPAAAQCSMCKAVLSSSNARFIRNFNIGVLVLLLPPVTIFCSIFVVLRRHRGESGIKSPDSGSESKTGRGMVDD